MTAGVHERSQTPARGVLHLDLAAARGPGLTPGELKRAREHALAALSDSPAAWSTDRDREREQAAVARRLAAVTSSTAGRRPPTVLLAHRTPWLRTLLEADLRAAGLQVSSSVDSLAQAVAALVVDQPDVLVVSDRLPGASGLAVAQRAAVLSPGTRVVAQVEADGNVRAAREVGAHAVLSRSARVQDLVDVVQLLAPRLLTSTPAQTPRAD